MGEDTMKEKMAMLEEMVRKGTISISEQLDLLHTLDESEKKAVWDDGAEFDPRKLMAKQQHSLTETLLEDILRTEKSRIFREILEKADGKPYIVDPELFARSEAKAEADRKSEDNRNLLDNLWVLHQKPDEEGLGYLLDLKRHRDFDQSPEMKNLTFDTVSNWFGRRAYRTVRTLTTSVQADQIDEIHLHPCNMERVDVTSADIDTIDFEITVTGYGATQEEANSDADGAYFWTDIEANRLWTRSAGLYPSPAAFDIVLTVPHDTCVHVSGQRVIAKDFRGSLNVFANQTEIDGVTGTVSIGNNPVGWIRAQRVTGSLTATTTLTPIDISQWRGDVNIKSVIGPVTLTDGSGRVSINGHRGDITLDGITTSKTDVVSRSGSICFKGTVMPSGSYNLRSTDGDVKVHLSERSDCGLFAESLHGKVIWTLEARNVWDEPVDEGMKKYANIRFGSGGFVATSQQADVHIGPYEGTIGT